MDISTVIVLLLCAVVCFSKNISLINVLSNLSLRANNLTISLKDVEIHNGVLSFEDVKVAADGIRYSFAKRAAFQKDAGERVVHYPDLVNSIDRSVDPCNDFYSFVCNGWIKSHPIPENLPLYTQTVQLSQKVINEVKAILQSLPQNVSREENLMRIFFQKCLQNTLRPDNSGMTMMFAKMRVLRRMRSITEWLLNMKTVSLFYDVTVSVDEYNSTANILQIVPSSSMMSAEMYFNPAYSKQFTATRDVLFKMLAIVSSEDIFMEFFTPNVLEHVRRIESLFRVDQTIAKILEETEFNTDSITVTVEELYQNLRSIDWIPYIAALVPVHLRYSLARREVRILQLTTIQRLEELQLSIDEQTLSDYLDWKIIFHFGSFLGQGFQQLMEEFTTQVYGVKGRDRTNDCVSLTMSTFYDITGKHYLERYFNFDSIFTVKEMVEDVRAAFLQMLNKNEWMDMSTKKQARRKAHAIRDYIGFDNSIFNETKRGKKYERLFFTADNSYYDVTMAVKLWMLESAFLKLDKPNTKDTFETDVTEVNAFYGASQNQIAIAAGILQPPFFNATLPRLMNYGAIGVVVGHEITHGFDDSGSSYDEKGNKNNWWDEATFKNFERKKQCFDQQYGSISVNDLNVKINGRRTEGENIADNGGMRAAIRAAQILSKRASERFTIAGLEDFTRMQYFFMNYALLWCGSTRRATLLESLANDDHPPDMYRVNVVLSNQPEFAQAFQCKRGSPMFPEHTCTLW
ncbi:hypothetical protein Q1695_001288 [Nippostrongylus brasiliensis]|nr:hypothetical protein Q1695_001288 [Nippostrongylus brasiliensis]